MQSSTQEKTRSYGNKCHTKDTQCRWHLSSASRSNPSIGGPCADSGSGPGYLSQHMESGMERGLACGLWRVRALQCHSRKLWAWNWDLHSPTRKMRWIQERQFSLLAASDQRWATGDSAVGWAAPLTGVGGVLLQAVPGFCESVFHFQCSPEELNRDTTIFLLLVALNDPQNTNIIESSSCVKIFLLLCY